MKYIFIGLMVFFFTLLWVFFFMGDSYNAASCAMAAAISGFLVTLYNEKE